MPFEQTTGAVTFLRVHETGMGFGPPEDHINCEVVVMLDSQPGKAFGLRLLDDTNRPIHQGMLDLLRDAFNHSRLVTIDYSRQADKDNGLINYVEMSLPPQVRVTEVPSSYNPAEDPAVQGLILDPTTLDNKFPLPPRPSKPVEDLAPELEGPPPFSEKLGMTWSHEPLFELRSEHSREIAVEISEPPLLMARARWYGSAAPIEMVVAEMDGTRLATGEELRIPPDRGKIGVSTEIQAAGQITVSVVNPNAGSVSVDIFVGISALHQGDDT